MFFILKYKCELRVEICVSTMMAQIKNFNYMILKRFLIFTGLNKSGVPKGSRTPVAAVKGRCPRPLDDGDKYSDYGVQTLV